MCVRVDASRRPARLRTAGFPLLPLLAWPLALAAAPHGHRKGYDPASFQEKVAVLARDPNILPADSGDIAVTPGTATRFTLTREAQLTSPFLARLSGGHAFPDECGVEYSAANTSQILQPFDEVELDRGAEQGVKPGDYYRIFDLGESYSAPGRWTGLGRLVKTKGVLKVEKVGPRSSSGRLVRCFGPISAHARACPLSSYADVTGTRYAPAEGAAEGRVVYLNTQQTLTQPFGYAIMDAGSAKGVKLADRVRLLRRKSAGAGDDALATGLVVDVREESATILLDGVASLDLRKGDRVRVAENLRP